MDPRDNLFWLVTTVKQEAEGEDELGQLAVAWVIVNRYNKAQTSISDIVLAPLQFSCWNGNSPTRRRLDEPIPYSCWRAAAAALFNLEPDPTKGATHYLNLALAQPSWYDETRRTLTHGNHTFLKLP